MAFSAFTDKKHTPSEAEVNEAIGTGLALWQELIRFVRQAYTPQEDFKFLYGQNYGWGYRFRIKNQMLINLYPARNGFVAQVNLREAAVQQALDLKPGQHLQQAIAAAHPYPEGRWLFTQVDCQEDVQDVRRLMELRAAEKRLL